MSLKNKSASSNICTKSSNSRWMKMAKIGLPKGSRKRLKVRETSVKSQGILKWILSGNPVHDFQQFGIWTCVDSDKPVPPPFKLKKTPRRIFK